ncbi:PQQ-dependent sugar dehydrogenase [Rodentibacter rarus]|nr:PQQ-dependent sugar dehydrogenase [Rodentibacter rarus]
MFQEEQGLASDDKVNLLEAVANYGWSLVASYPNNQNYV